MERLRDLARDGLGHRNQKPCAEQLPGISRWAVVGCQGDVFDLRGWIQLVVPEGWAALDAERRDVSQATARWLLPVLGRHEPVVLFGEIKPRRDGVAKVLVSRCPVSTIDALVNGLDGFTASVREDGFSVDRDRVEIGQLPTDRIVLRYPEKTIGDEVYGSTLAAVWATYTDDGAFAVQADFPNFVEDDEKAVATFFGAGSRDGLDT